MNTFKIVRFHREDNHPDNHKVIKTGLTEDWTEKIRTQTPNPHSCQLWGFFFWTGHYGLNPGTRIFLITIIDSRLQIQM